MKLWDLATKKERGVLKGHTGEVITVAFSPDGKMLATGSGTGDGSVKLWSWDGTTAQDRVTIPLASGSWGRPVQFSADGKTLAIGMNTVDLYDVATGNKRASLTGHGGDSRRTRLCCRWQDLGLRKWRPDSPGLGPGFRART